MYPPPTPKHPRTGGSIAWILLKFGFVGGLGIFLNQYVLFVLTGFYGVYFLFSAILSSQAAVLVNFALNNFLVFRSRESAGGLVRKALLFNAVSSSDLLLRIPLLWGLTSAVGISYLWSNLASIFLTFGRRRSGPSARPRSAHRHGSSGKVTVLIASNECLDRMDQLQHRLKLKPEQLSRLRRGESVLSLSH